MSTELYRNEFLYFSWDSFSHVMRMAVTLKEEINGSVLNDAVSRAAARYPYYCIKTVRRGEDYEIVHNDLPVTVRHGKKPPVLGSAQANGHFIAVGYEGRDIFFDVYHNLTDAKGESEWVRTVLYLYITSKTGLDLPPGDIRLPGEPFLEGEIKDIYSVMDLETATRPLSPPRRADAFIIDKRYAESHERKNYLIRISEEDTIRFGKGRDGSPVSVLAYAVREMLIKLFPDRDGKTLVMGIPHSFRGLASMENNAYNDAVILSVFLDKRTDPYDAGKLMTCIRGSVILQSDPDNVLYFLRNRAVFAESADHYPTIDERRLAYKNACSILIDNPESAAVSYVGRINWGSMAEYMDGIAFHCSALSAPLLIEAFPLNGWFYVSIMLDQTAEIYARTMVGIMRDAGIRSEYIKSFDNDLCSVVFE